MKVKMGLLENNEMHAVAILDLEPENDAERELLGQLAEMNLLSRQTGFSEDIKQATITLHQGYGANRKRICQCT